MNLMRVDPRGTPTRRTGPGTAELTRAARAAGSANGLCPVMGNP